MSGGLNMNYEEDLTVSETPIPGLLVIRLPVRGDNRGWFKENWQRKKMVALGLPDFRPVQNNVSYNAKRGTTRGLHAEPWDKYVAIAQGSAFGTWVDLREGESFGRVFTTDLDPSVAVFVPRGVANGFQTLEDDVSYTYLVNDHWSPDRQNDYRMVNLRDPDLRIEWPIHPDYWETSQKDDEHPLLSEVTPFESKRILVLGKNGQLSNALVKALPADGSVDFLGMPEVDLLEDTWVTQVNWPRYRVVINATAFTAVDLAETDIEKAWCLNARAVQQIALRCSAVGALLVHVSTDYVFDGTDTQPTGETGSVSPASAYGASKAAGDLCVQMLERHYLVRTSWVVGDGANFVRTMQSLARKRKEVKVVDDQVGRLTFASDLAEFIVFLIENNAPFGTYNFTSEGDAVSWYQIAQLVFAHELGENSLVSPQSTEEFATSRGGRVAPRPANSVLALDKLKQVGYQAPDQIEALNDYLENSL